MSLRSGSLGSMLQGVNQQPDRIRLDGQVTEQINMRSDATTGLATRPTTDEIGLLAGATADMSFHKVRFEDEDFILGYGDNTFNMWDLQGNAQAVTFDGTTLDYIGPEMVFHVVDDRLVLVNRNTVVATDPTVEPERPSVGLVQALGGQFSNTYEVELDFISLTGGSDVFTVNSYTAPDGDATGDASRTSSDFIIQALADAITNNVATPAGTVVEVYSEVMRITNPDYELRITTRDGEGGTILRSQTAEVQDLDDLPRFAPNGQIVKVVNSAVYEDDYWLKFVVAGETVEDGATGFGSAGIWQEWYDPSLERLYDLTTMPHIVERDGADFVMRQGPWIGRPVGDDTTAPFATIVGKPIRDISGFESRIVLITPNTVVMSRTDEPFDLWRESATTQVATDPIDFTSTKKDDLRLDWLIPFDRDLIVVADPGDSQFVIRGGEITALNAGMVLTTEFQVESNGARPVSTGRTIMLPFVVGRFSGVKEFYTNSDNNANAADSLTETQDRYISGRMVHMAVSQNFNLSLFKTDQDEDTVWVYEYLWDRNELLQSAWHKWVFKDDVKYFFFDNSEVYFVSAAREGVVLHSLDLNRPLNAYGFHTTLDRARPAVVSNNRVTLPFTPAKFMQAGGTSFPGVEVKPVFILRQSDTSYDYVFDEDDVSNGMTVVAGQPVEWQVQPTQVYAKDYQQRVDTSQRVTIQDYVVHVDSSGVFSVAGTSPYGDAWEYNSFSLTLDNDPIDPEGLGLFTGPITFPWGERADYSTLTIKGDDIRPVTIYEVEWVGQVLKSRGRRS